MCMTRLPSIKNIVCVCLLLAMAAPVVPHAQQNRSSVRPQSRVEWPRTFGGQPDFEFERTEALQAVQAERTRTGMAPFVLPTLADLLADEDVNLFTAPKLTSPTEVATDVLDDDDLAGLSAPLEVAELPSLTEVTAVDLTEFEDMLVAVAAEKLQNYQPSLQGMNLQYLISYLQVQSIMVSPVQAATINGMRYSVGDTITLSAPLTPTDAELLDAMRAHMPALDGMPANLQQAYQQAFENAIAKLAALRQASPQLFSKTTPIPVKIVGIMPRKVVVESAGQSYELPIKVR
jgi:hypothetical protein